MGLRSENSILKSLITFLTQQLFTHVGYQVEHLLRVKQSMLPMTLSQTHQDNSSQVWKHLTLPQLILPLQDLTHTPHLHNQSLVSCLSLSLMSDHSESLT